MSYLDSIFSPFWANRKEFEETLSMLKDILLPVTESNNEFELEVPVSGSNPVYVLTIKVPQSVTNKDIDIEYDADCREISISYETKISENSTSAMSLIKTLPYDAISDTLSAVVVNGVLTVTVEQNTSKSLTSDDSQTINIKRINQKQRGC